MEVINLFLTHFSSDDKRVKKDNIDWSNKIYILRDRNYVLYRNTYVPKRSTPTIHKFVHFQLWTPRL